MLASIQDLTGLAFQVGVMALLGGRTLATGIGRMFIIGVKIAFAGRLRGLARVWPLVAESWAVVTVPSFVILGSAVADVVGGLHLLIGYVALGLILVRRPELVLPRR